MKLSLVIQGIDRITAPIRKIERTTGGLGKMFKRTGGEAGSMSRALDGVGRAGLVGASGLGVLANKVARLAGAGGLLALRKSAEGAKSALRGALGLAGGLATGAAIGAVGAAGWFGSSMIGIAGRFEQFEVQLEGIMGSATAAKSAMAWVRKFGQETPYEVEEITDAFVLAKQNGIDPFNGSLRQMGDAASGARKILGDAVRAVADAMRSQNERLFDFGIAASVKGNATTFNYLTKTGKKASKTVRKDMESIREAVLKIFDEKFGGGMARQSKTLFGIWGNLKDLFSGFQLDIANAGFFDFLKQQLQDFFNYMNMLQADGTLKRYAKETSKWLVDSGKEIVAFFKAIKWADVRSDISATGEAIVLMARGIVFASKAVRYWRDTNPVTVIGNGLGAVGNAYAGAVNYGFRPRGPSAAPRSAPGRRVDWSSAQANAANSAMSLQATIKVVTEPGTRAAVYDVKTSGPASIRLKRGRSMDHTH